MAGEPKITIRNGAGGLDYETDYNAANLDGSPKFNPNNVADSRNIRSLGDGSSSSGGNVPVYGNELDFDLGSVEESDKKIRIYYDFTDGDDLGVSIIVYDGDGAILYSSPFSTTINNATYAANDVDAYLQAELTGAGIGTFTYNHTSGTDYTDATFDGGEWTIVFYIAILPSIVNTIQETVTLIEYIPVDLTGQLQVIGSTQVGEDLFVFSANKNIDGVGEIGVRTKSQFDYSYVRLLRSKNLTLGYENLIDVVGEKNGDVVSLYYADDINEYRNFTYRGGYVTDGALNVVDADNYYSLDFVSEQSQLEPYPVGTPVVLDSQIQVGGGLTSGNKRYTLVYVTNFGGETEPIPLSNPVNVFSPSLGGSAIDLCGDDDGTVTSKINVLTLPACNTAIFPKVKLICVSYTDTTATAVVVNTFSTSLNTQNVYHTGLEITSEYTTAFLNPTKEEVLHGLNNRILDNRLVQSNYVVREQLDFTAFFDSFVLTTEIKDDIVSEGGGIDTAGSGMVVGGYFEPTNVNAYAGYMDNETYRIGGRVKFKNGGYSLVFHIEDYTIDAGTDISLTTTAGEYIRARYIQATGMDYNLLPNGVTIDDIEGIEIMRADCVPEILATGYGYPLYGYDDGADAYWFPFVNNQFNLATEYGLYSRLMNFISPDLIFKNTRAEFISGDSLYYSDICQQSYLNNYLNASTTNSVFSQQTGYISTANYSSDALVDSFFVESTVNSPTSNSAITIPSASTNKLAISYGILGLNNYYCANQLTTANPAGLGSDKTYYNRYAPNQTILVTTSNLIPSYDGDTAVTYAGIYMQYYRPLTNKYGAHEDTIYKPTGTFVDTTATTIDIWGGDTFIEKTTYKMGIFDTPVDGTQKDDATIGISFFSQNRVHSQMRYQYDGGYIFPFSLSGSAAWSDKVADWLEQEVNEGIFYTDAYTIRNNENAYASYDDSLIYNSDRPTRIRWSDTKPIGSTIDYYSIFRAANIRDLEVANGEIIHMEIINGELWTWQNSYAFMRQFFNNDGQLNTIDSSLVLIGDGSVMSRRGVTLSSIGATHKWSVRKGKSRGGSDIVVWLNSDLGVISRFGADGVLVLSDQFEIRHWLLEQSKILNVLEKSEVLWGDNVYTGYDDANKEFLFSFRNWIDIVPFDGVPYAKGSIVQYSTDLTFYAIPKYYIAKKDTSGQYPNDTNYWLDITDQYVSHTTLVFSENKHSFTTRYDFVPKLYMMYGNYFLTSCPVNYTNSGGTQVLSYSQVYSHEKGEVCSWWGGLAVNVSAFVVDVNGYDVDITYPVALSDLPDKGWVLEIYDDSSPYPSYYHIISLNVTIITVDKQITIDPLTITEMNIIPAFCYDAYVEFLVNDNPIIQKNLKGLKMDIEVEPKEVWHYTLGQETYALQRNPDNGNQSDFFLDGQLYKTPVRRDTTISGDNTAHGDRLKGKWYKIKVIMKAFEVNNLRQIISKYHEKLRNLT
jgi:hypothetical protein